MDHVPFTQLVKIKFSEFWFVCNLCYFLMFILKCHCKFFVPTDIRVKEPTLESLCRSVLKVNDFLLNFLWQYFTVVLKFYTVASLLPMHTLIIFSLLSLFLSEEESSMNHLDI
jgi:hypothetical protein